MAKIRQSNLDGSVITGNTTLNETANLSDLILVYDQSSGTLKQISRKNLVGFPTVSSVSPTSVTSGDGTGNYTFTVTGSGFTGSNASFVNTSGTTVNADTVTIDSDTQITMVIAKSSFPGSGEPYDVKVTNSIGLITVLENQINIDQSPTYVTAAGSLLNLVEGSTIPTTDIIAYDPESAGNVTFELQSGSLPAGLSAITVNENGVSKYRITGTLPTPGSTTVYNFTLRAADAASNTSSRAFSITARVPTSESFTSSGTFSVPSGITQADVLVVGGGGGGQLCAGGGGGAGGLIFMPAYPLTPGGTVTVTVGCGGTQGDYPYSPGISVSAGQDSAFGSPGDPGLSSGGVLTAKGGGKGGGSGQSVPTSDAQGGSGGGGYHGGSGYGGLATQPTQPGNSGAYGFGNPGGNGTPSPNFRGGGGGGAGAAGAQGGAGAAGGVGKAYTIADGTTPVYYAGGGGGGIHNGPSTPGGQGGGGNSRPSPSINGGANTGGGGGSGCNLNPGGSGGKGIVIVRY